MRNTLRLIALTGLLSVVATLAGCSNQPAVAGKVSVRGTPLNAGTVTFRSGDMIRGGTIQPDGTYKIIECPPGQYTVTVEVPNLKFQKTSRGSVPKSAEMPGKVAAENQSATSPVPVDSKYRDPTRSGLSFVVSADNRNIDIELR